MRTILFALSLSLPCTSLYAQDMKPKITSPNAWHNEIGLFTVSPIGSQYNENFNNTGLSGIQYNHWVNERKGFKVFAAYGNYRSSNATEGYVAGDTAILKKDAAHADLAVIGGALQAQRHFFRKVYLSAAVEIKAGYGSGFTDTTFTKYYHYKDLNIVEASGMRGTGKLNTFYAALTPSIGGRIQFKRIAIGLDMMLELVNYTAMTYNNSSNNMLDLDLDKTSARLFVNYRF
jgi:hypothetical protein